jgi:hypothetical protein
VERDPADGDGTDEGDQPPEHFRHETPGCIRRNLSDSTVLRLCFAHPK